jgi:5-formaminoimidazole-4-carboxamide-1-(beta)-D-ribofuranosyl 5'-monophosphate synthetase
MFGTREMLKLEERDVEHNQYWLLQQAGIRIPKIYSSPKEIDRLVLVKVNEAKRGYERAFFYAVNEESFNEEANKRLKSGLITEEALKKAVIEEFILEAQVNFNYFYSPLNNKLELMGTDTRRQTNLDGFLRLPAKEQNEVRSYIEPSIIETGHIAVTIKESLVEKAYEAGEKFVAVTKKHHIPGIIGPFALQGAIAQEDGKEEIVIFDVSLRIPGSPGTAYTPYTKYMYGENLSYGERIAMEIEAAIKTNRMIDLLT